MTRTPPNTSRAEWQQGWRVVCAAGLGVGTTWHFFQIVSGLFILPMQADFGWSRSRVAIGPLAGLISILFYPLAGSLIDRFGPRTIALIGLISLSVAWLCFAVIPPNIVVFYALITCIAMIGSISNQIVFAKGLATGFYRAYGSAIGIMMSGLTLTTALGIPMLAEVIAHFGWRAGFVCLAAIIALVGLPINLAWFRMRGARAARSVGGGSLRPALHDSRFWMLALAVGVAAVPIGGFLTHLQPLLIGRGLSIGVSAAYGSLFVIAVGLGRIFVGLLLDRLYPPLVAASTLVLSAAGVAVLSQISTRLTPSFGIGLAVSLIGLAQGAESDYISFFTLKLFGFDNFSKLVGLLSMAVGGGMAVGGFAFAAVFDRRGSYQLAIQGSIFLLLIAAAAFIAIRVPTHSDHALLSEPT